MAKFIDASCQASVVTADGKPVQAEILSQGTKPSTGVLLMEADKRAYITSNASDIKDLITNIKSVLDQIVIVLSALDAVSTSPGSTTAATELVTTLSTTLALQKELLK